MYRGNSDNAEELLSEIMVVKIEFEVFFNINGRRESRYDQRRCQKETDCK